MGTTKIKKATTNTYTVTKKSKDTVFEFSNETVAQASSLTFSYSGGANYGRKGNDLIISFHFGEQHYEGNYVIYTIKDYYKYSNDSYKDIIKFNLNNYDNLKNPVYTYASGTVVDKETGNVFVGDKKATTYNIIYSTNQTDITELAGNDTYNINKIYNGSNVISVNDYSGNDKYYQKQYSSSENGSNTIIYDYKGNDEYEYSGKQSGTYVTDYNGNDKFSITNVLACTNNLAIKDKNGKDSYYINNSKGISLTDEKGNDKYVVKNISQLDGDIYLRDLIIYDYVGNDTYQFNNVHYKEINEDEFNATIFNFRDQKGDDKYTFENVSNIAMADEGGKDKYTIKYADNIDIRDTGMENDTYSVADTNKVYLFNREGNEKYTISGVSNIEINEEKGNDKYSFSEYCSNIDITDEDGKDKYSITNSHIESIKDKGGDDQYSVINCQFTKALSCIDDYDGNDSYVIKNSYGDVNDQKGNDNYTITNSDVIVSDLKGNDTYSIVNPDCTRIWDFDENSNDVYKINKLTGAVDICDCGGANDKLTLSKVKASNLIFMLDFKKDGQGVYSTENGSSSLLILDKSTNGLVSIDGYFDTRTQAEITSVNGTANGKIESIKAGKRELTSDINSFVNNSTYINQLNSVVATWLTNNNFDNVSDLVNPINQNKIGDFIAYITDGVNYGA